MCSGPLLRVAAILSALRAGDCGFPLLRIGHARVWVVACPPLLREGRAAAPLVPLMPCASAKISFRSILALLDFPYCGGFSGLVQVFSCLALSVLSEASPTFHRLISLRYGCVSLKESSLTIFLEVMTGRGLLSVPGHRHCRPCRAFSSFFRPFSIPPLVTAFTLKKALRLRNVSFFLFLLPRSQLAGPCFRSVGWFSSWWEWWLPLVEASG